MEANEIVRRFDALEAERKGSVEQLWDLIEQFVLPFRGDFYATLNSEHEVDWHRRDIYDSTAVFALQALAASIHGNLTSPSTRWFDLKFRNEELNNDTTAMRWLEACAELLFEALQDSNFNIEIAETYLDLGGFGTAVLTETTDDDIVWQGLQFGAIPLRECFFEEDHKGNVHILYRRHQWTPLQIKTKFGEENLPQHIKERLNDDKSIKEKLTVVYCIGPRKGQENADTTKVLASDKRPFYGKYILHSTKEQLGEDVGYYEMPAFVARWRKVAGSRWGHSPASVALGDILTLNQLIEAILEAAGKHIDPTVLANESSIISDLDLDRGTLNVVTDVDGVKAFESGTRFDVGSLQVDMLRESIRKAFYQDQLELKDSPAMTATEVNVRYEMIQRLLGPTAGRVQTDLLDKLVERGFKMMYRAGQMPPVPDGIEISELDIEYTGPLPRSQKMEDALAIDRWMMGLVEKAEVFPDAMDLLDVDGAERHKAKLLGVPAEAIRGEDEVKKIRDDRQKQQVKADALATAQQGGMAAEAMGKGAQAMNAANLDPAAIAQAVGGGNA